MNKLEIPRWVFGKAGIKRSQEGPCGAFFNFPFLLICTVEKKISDVLRARAGLFKKGPDARSPVAGIMGVRKVELMLCYFYDRNQSSLVPSDEIWYWFGIFITVCMATPLLPGNLIVAK